MAVAGFTSPLHNRSHPVLSFTTQATPLKPSPFPFHISLNHSTSWLLSSKRRLVLSCSETNDNSITTTSVNDPPSSDSNKPASEPVESGNNGSAKRAPLTARERLRAARVLSRYTEATPEAPTNMLDDSKRGMPKKGLTFDLPGSADILVIAFSFVFISTVMFATTYVVWKLGAIHFNEN